MESDGYGIFCGYVSPVCKLVWVQGGGETGFDVSQNQFLKALGNDWGEAGGGCSSRQSDVAECRV